MKAIIPSGRSLKPRLVIADRGKPKPGPQDVLVKVHAASVNPKDWKLNLQLGNLATPLGRHWLPAVFGDDLAGEVVAKGAKVEGFEVGDRVYGMDMRLRTASLAEYAVIDQRRIAVMPKKLSFIDAAAAPLAAQTALQGLRQAGAGQGSSVLIIGASGGVGTYAVQIAKLLGCEVTAVCSTRNVERVKELGADAVIDYTQDDFRKTGQQYDVVFDVTSFETPGSCAALLKPTGHFVSTMGHARALISTLLTKRQKASIVVVESYTEDLETLGEWMAAGKLKSIIDCRVPLAESQWAYERSRSGRAQGKIVIEITRES
ncbi:MAG: NAD(P)-dependent alcohol dehydrogenase [Nevskiales bacterium]